ncbi:hypothetical protein [Mesorhizobium sp. B2-3-4]|uniref:hypothetical protein n=1 Tax=Mesorhizobium sp. B2-3-4 TaxID=2589959 RepID=UPI001127481D|nr:hypothetical protein [Mesorhizobium sp. B2-3-4]TPM41400.1 hypothetical protein FJ967_00235 [Mesorhizobium sp. B2-3-4]
MKKHTKGKLAVPKLLQIKMVAHPDIAANMEIIATALGLTSSTEVIKVALHHMVQREMQREAAGKTSSLSSQMIAGRN